jgi:serine protease Do
MIALMLTLALNQDDSLQESLSKVARKIRKDARPAVVAILVTRTRDPEGIGPRGKRAEHEDYYNRPKGYCTGTILTPDGLVATSYFNVSPEIKSIQVLVEGRREAYPAKLIGFDRKKDIALLKIEPEEPLKVLPRADPAKAKVGGFMFILGRAPDPDSPTINFGILSATHRFDGSHVQTDAELNYGNVGGPLVDIHGRLIGITTHIRTRTHWGQSGGVGFAIRIDKLQEMIPTLKKDPAAQKPRKRHATLGVIPADGAKDLEGVQIADVLHGSPAQKAGLRAGDIITELDGKPVKNEKDLQKILDSKSPGDKVSITIKRADDEGNYRERKGTITLGEEEAEEY